MASRRKPRTMEQVIQIRCNSANYRAKELGLSGRLVPAGFNLVPETCVFCGVKLTPSNVSLDHIQPFSKGGENSWANVQWIDQKCNKYRRNSSCQEWSEFLQHLGPWTGFFFKNYRPRGWRY